MFVGKLIIWALKSVLMTAGLALVVCVYGFIYGGVSFVVALILNFTGIYFVNSPVMWGVVGALFGGGYAFFANFLAALCYVCAEFLEVFSKDTDSESHAIHKD